MPVAYRRRYANQLADMLGNIQFFKERDLSKKEVLRVSLCLEPLYMKENEVVFDFNTQGDLFYIIL